MTGALFETFVTINIQTRRYVLSCSQVPNVAIIALHGVANQMPGATSAAVTDLLLRRDWELADENPIVLPRRGTSKFFRLTGNGVCPLDLYECYWADLSKVRPGVLGLLASLGAFLFSVVKLGLAAAQGILTDSSSPVTMTKWVIRLANAFEKLFYNGPPVFAILQLSGLLLLSCDAWKNSTEAVIAIWVFLSVLICYWTTWTLRLPPLLFPALGALVGIVLGVQMQMIWPLLSAAIPTLILVTVSLASLARRYSPTWGSLPWLGSLLAIFFCASVWSVSPSFKIRATQCIEVWAFLHHLSWLVGFGLILLGGMSQIVAQSSKSGRERRAFLSASWTIRASQSIATFSLLLAVNAVWAAAFKVTFELGYFPESSTYRSLLPWWFFPPFRGGVFAPDSVANFLILVVGVLACITTGLTFLPLLAKELAPSHNRDASVSKAVGLWLNRALRNLRFLPDSLLVVGGFALLAGVVDFYEQEKVREIAKTFLFYVGGSIAGAIGIGAAVQSSRLFSWLGKAATPIFDVMLDATNYLLEYPTDSLKRQIHARLDEVFTLARGPDGNRPVVVVAHSLGSIIALEYIREKAECKSAPIYLLTFGSPLRQLLSGALPHRFGWLLESGRVPPFGVRYWLNAYTSGDYIGRYLWLSSEDPVVFSPTLEPSLPEPDFELCKDYCLGDGGHTNYWTDEIVGTLLRGLILKANEGEENE